MNLTEGDDSLLRHTQNLLARDIISYSGTMFSCVVYYIVNFKIIASLGQIAFAVFQVLFAITQLLCHVSVLLTSACRQAYNYYVSAFNILCTC